MEGRKQHLTTLPQISQPTASTSKHQHTSPTSITQGELYVLYFTKLGDQAKAQISIAFVSLRIIPPCARGGFCARTGILPIPNTQLLKRQRRQTALDANQRQTSLVDISLPSPSSEGGTDTCHLERSKCQLTQNTCAV